MGRSLPGPPRRRPGTHPQAGVRGHPRVRGLHRRAVPVVPRGAAGAAPGRQGGAGDARAGEVAPEPQGRVWPYRGLVAAARGLHPSGVAVDARHGVRVCAADSVSDGGVV